MKEKQKERKILIEESLKEIKREEKVKKERNK
jgi:hypothetical protein